MLLIRTLLVLFVFAAGAQGAAAAEAWRVVASTGAVKAGAPGVMPVAVNTKQTLPADSWIETAATGRIVVARGVETIAVGPNSRVMLPTLPVNGNTQVLQTVGTALYQIGKQKAPHFQVDTPYLAAVVKGTTFTVSVSEGVASVDVSEGLVQVATPDGANSAYVQPGFTGTVLQSQRDKVVVAPTKDGSDAVSPSFDGSKSKSGLLKETSHSKERVIIPAAIGEVALDVKAVSGGLATGMDTPTKGGGSKVASTVTSIVSTATDVVSDKKGDSASSSSSATSSVASVDVSSSAGGAAAGVDVGNGAASVDVSSSAGGVAAGVDVGGGAASVDVSSSAGGVAAGVDVGNGVASVDVGAGSGGVSVDVGVGGGNGNGNALGVGVGVGGGGVTVGVGVGNGGLGIGIGIGNGNGGGGGGGLLGLGLGGGRGH
jgi:hypothetical protein